MGAQTSEVDQVEVGALARGEHAAIAEAVERGVAARQLAHHRLERNVQRVVRPRVAHPARQHVRVHAGIGDEAHVRAGVAQAQHAQRVAQHRMQRVRRAVGVVHAEMRQHRATAVAEQDVVGRRPGALAARLREVGDAFLARRRVVDRVAGDIGVLPQRRVLVDQREARVVRIFLGEQAGADLGRRHGRVALGEGQVLQRRVARHEAPGVLAFEAEEDRNRAAADLRDQALAGARGRFAMRELALPLRRVDVVLEQQEHHRAARARGDAAHHLHVAIEARRIFADDAGVHHLDEAVAARVHRAGNGDEFVLARIGARHRPAIDRDVDRGARGREADGAGGHGFARQRRHAPEVVFGRGFVRGAAFAHHVGAQRAVRKLGRHVEAAWRRVERIEVLGKAFPVPAHAGAQAGARDVLDAFHEADEPVAAARGGRCKTDAAVAHDRRRDAVAQRRGEFRVPADLAVIVRVDVDPAGRDREAIGIDHAGRAAQLAADGLDDTVPDRDVTDEGRRPRAVDDATAANQRVIPGHLLLLVSSVADTRQGARHQRALPTIVQSPGQRLQSA